MLVALNISSSKSKSHKYSYNSWQVYSLISTDHIYIITIYKVWRFHDWSEQCSISVAWWSSTLFVQTKLGSHVPRCLVKITKWLIYSNRTVLKFLVLANYMVSGLFIQTYGHTNLFDIKCETWVSTACTEYIKMQ